MKSQSEDSYILKLDPNSTEPRYIQIKKALIKYIKKHRMKSDELFFSENDLCKYFGVTRLTIRRAIQEMVLEGWLYKEKGRGTFISPKQGRIKLDNNKFYYNIRALFFGGSEIMETARNIISLYEKKFTSVSCEKINIYRDDYISVIQELLNNNNYLDIVALNEEILTSMVNHNWLMPLNNLVKELDLDNFYKEVLDIFKINGNYYGIPFAFSPIVIFYNSDLLKKYEIEIPPKDKFTWNKFREILHTIKIKSNDQIKGIGIELNNISRLLTFIKQNNGELYDETQNKYLLDSIEAKDAINFLYKLIYKDKLGINTTDIGNETTVNLFTRGHIAMTIDTFYHLHLYRNITNFQWDITYLPFQKRKVNIIIPVGFGIIKTTKRPRLISEIIKFVLNPKNEQTIMNNGVGLAILKNIAESRYNLKNNKFPKSYLIFKEELKYGMPIKFSPYFRSYIPILNELNLIWLGVEDIDSALKESVYKANLLLKKF